MQKTFISFIFRDSADSILTNYHIISYTDKTLMVLGDVKFICSDGAPDIIQTICKNYGLRLNTSWRYAVFSRRHYAQAAQTYNQIMITISHRELSQMQMARGYFVKIDTASGVINTNYLEHAFTADDVNLGLFRETLPKLLELVDKN